MRISDWSSDVCSSDLILVLPVLRRYALPFALLATTALAGCATTNPPPEISYDSAAPAVQTVDPPAPVQVVELPRPLPLPGQLQRVEPSRRTPEPADPTARVNQANAAARIQPVRDGFINSRSEEHTSELQSLMRISYAVFCLKKKKT